MIENLCDDPEFARGKILLRFREYTFRAAHIGDELLAERHGWKRIEIGWVGIVPAECTLIDRLHVVADVAVVAARVPSTLKALGQPDRLGNFRCRHAVIDHAQRLVVGELIEIALLFQMRLHPRIAPDRPMVLSDQNFGVVAPHLERFAEITRPCQRVADLGAAEGQEVMKVMRGVLRHVEHFQLRQIEMEFSGRFALRCHLKHEFETVDDPFVAGGHDQIGGRHQRNRSGGHRFAETAIDLSASAARNERPKLILRSPQHRIASDHVLGDGKFHEQVRRDDRHPAARHILIAEHAACAAPVIGVGVGVDHRCHRLAPAMLEVEFKPGTCTLSRGEGVDHDDTGVAFDQGHVGDVEAAYLIDARTDLEQAVVHVELRLPPQAWIDGGWRSVRGEKAVRLERPDHATLRIRDGCIGKCVDEAAACVLVILTVLER